MPPTPLRASYSARSGESSREQAIEFAHRDLAELTARYGLGEASECRLIHVGTRNVFHRLVTPDRVLAVRQVLRSREETERQHELLTYLADGGFPAVPPLSTRSGETVVAIDERTFAVYPFVARERPGAGDTVTASSVGWAAARLSRSDRRLPVCGAESSFAGARPFPGELVRVVQAR